MTLVGRPILTVGTLTIKGDQFAFAPAPGHTFEVKAGEEFEVGLVYQYEEASADRESAAVRFTARLGSTELGAKDARIEDRPVVKDVERGTLALVARLPRGGEVQGTFRIEAGSASAPWGGEAPAKGKAFERTGTFRVRAT